ncbi:MAG: hypothetical protein GC200_12180 [Tepidisphaera sp.]|nr:hypothetical protein [Tepidisphaera sp.]
MGSNGINSVFLSGWEYNRVLSSSPFERVVSGLPAEILWNGSAQFWLFENVYCSEESYLGELAAKEDLGWASGEIFEDLRKRAFLKPIDLETTANESTKSAMLTAHRMLHQDVSEAILLEQLRNGNEVALEALKLRMLSPLLDQLGCVKNISHNSIRHWKPASAPEESDVERALRRLVEPLRTARAPMRLAEPLCDRPGTGVSAEHLALQKAVEQEIEVPMIPDLLAGRLPQSDYHHKLKPRRGVYRPITSQLLTAYRQRVNILEELREAAQTSGLWHNLHRNWLPRLQEDPSFVGEFDIVVRDALAAAQFGKLLTRASTAVFYVAASLTVYTASQVLGHEGTTAIAVPITAAAEKATEYVHERTNAVRPLTLFYQKVL